MPAVVYIAGYGRSGSTVLDIMLNAHPEIVGAGELTYLFDEIIAPGRVCACDRAYQACVIWGPLTQRVDIARAARVTRQLDKRRALILGPATAGPGGDDARLDAEYRQLMWTVFGHIGAVTGARYVVDSSKTAREAAYRPLALRDIAGLEVKVIHLVRAMTKTVQSLHRLDNWKAEGHSRRLRFAGLRAAPGWLLANENASRLAREFGPDSYLKLRCEELRHDPESVIRQLSTFLDCDLSDVLARIGAGRPFAPGHQVGGNRLRKEGGVVFRAASA